MIIAEKVRSMSRKDQFRYYLEKLADTDTPENAKSEAVEHLSAIMEGVDINEIDKEFGIPCTFDQKSVPATLTFTLENGHEVVFDFIVEDRNQFDGAHPEKRRVIQSFLTSEEKQDIAEQTGVTLGK